MKVRESGKEKRQKGKKEEDLTEVKRKKHYNWQFPHFKTFETPRNSLFTMASRTRKSSLEGAVAAFLC